MAVSDKATGKVAEMKSTDTIIPIDRFFIHKDNVAGRRRDGRQKWVLTGEWSDLEGWLGRRFDHCDEFVVHGHRADIRFVRSHVDEDGEEIRGVWYKPAPGQERLLDKAIVELLVIND